MAGFSLRASVWSSLCCAILVRCRVVPQAERRCTVMLAATALTAIPNGGPTNPAADAGRSHRTMDLDLIKLRLQALYAALAALPASVPLADAPRHDQQEYNLPAAISQLEAALAKAKQAPAKSGQQE